MTLGLLSGHEWIVMVSICRLTEEDFCDNCVSPLEAEYSIESPINDKVSQ